MSSREIFDFVKQLLIGSISTKLITIGLTFFGLGIWDVAVYFIQAVVLHKSVEPPGDQIGLSQVIGFLCLIIGLGIKAYQYYKNSNISLRERRLWLKENYKTLSDAKLQDEFEWCYSVKNADIRGIKNILDHPYNKNLVIKMFANCHQHIIPNGAWFSEDGKFLSLRYNIGFLVWLAFPILVFFCLLLAIAETLSPGISKSGPYANISFLILGALTVVGATILWHELKALGNAITLVNKYNPNPI